MVKGCLFGIFNVRVLIYCRLLRTFLLYVSSKTFLTNCRSALSSNKLLKKKKILHFEVNMYCPCARRLELSTPMLLGKGNLPLLGSH